MVKEGVRRSNETKMGEKKVAERREELGNRKREKQNLYCK